jgi:hypothetical protein
VPPPLVWYASYGSNLWANRFRCYIEGGTPRGAADECRGARDKTPFRAERAFEIPYRLYFAGHSRTWDGAPCFVDLVEEPATAARARAYLITWEQFEDVVAQENGRPTTSAIELELDDLTPGRSHSLGPRRYENLRCVDRFDQVPVVTITSPKTMAEAELGAPAHEYLRTMIDGLRESHHMRDDALVAYLSAAPGCSGELVAAVLDR